MSRSPILLSFRLLMAVMLVPYGLAFVARSASISNSIILESQRHPKLLPLERFGWIDQTTQPTLRRCPATLLAAAKDGTEKKSSLPFFLDPGTKGGAVFLSLVLFVVPIILYNISLSMGLDMIDANRIFGIGFTVVLSLAWVSTYIFRVATKDMTYAKQLKDYENAVMQKRLEELDEDEVQALMEEVDRDEF